MHCKLFFFLEDFCYTGNFILFYIFKNNWKIPQNNIISSFFLIFCNTLAKMPKYSPQQKTLPGINSSEISLNEWNFVNILGPDSTADTGCRAQCKIRFPPKALVIMVQFRFRWGHFRTTEWSVDGGFCTTEWSVDDGFCATEWSVDGGFCQVIMLWAWLLGLCNCQNPCSKTHSLVLKARNAPGILKT